MGKRYLLNVINANSVPKVEIKQTKYIDMYIRPGTSIEKREKIMDNFYRSELKKQIPALISKWEKITKICIWEFRIRKMKTKWGSCNQKYRRIWINLELAKKTLQCLEYIIVHEMTHLIEKKHNLEFKRLIYLAMPNWLQYKEELNNSIRGYSKWKNITT